MTLVGLRFTIRRLIKALPVTHKVRIFQIDDRSIYIWVDESNHSEETFDVLLEIRHNDDEQFNKSIAFVDAFSEHTGMDKFSYVSVIIGRITKDVTLFSDNAVDATPTIYSKIEKAKDARLCECNNAIIPDDEGLCFACGIALDSIDMGHTHCPICFDLRIGKIVRTSCCKQPLHATCLAKNGQFRRSCPLCRNPEVTACPFS